MLRSAMIMVAVAGIAGAAHAQFAITPGGANAGNGWFRNGAIPTSLTGSGNSAGELRPGTSSSTDNLFSAQWWFRAQSDTREYVFGTGSATGGPTSAGVLVGTNDGSASIGGYDYTVSNATQSYSFNSAHRYEIFDGGTGPQVVATNTVTNTGNSAARITMYFYADFDVNGTAGTDTWAFAGNQFTITDGPSTINWAGYGADAHQSTAFAALRTLLTNTAVNNLDNTDAGSPGDFTGAFQWTVTLDPGASTTFVSGIGLNAPAIPAPGALALLGLGGAAFLRRRR